MSNRSTVGSKSYCRSVKSYLKQIGNFLYSLRLLYSLSLLVDLLSNIPLLSIITRPSQAKPPTRPPFCLISALQTFDLTISVVVLPQYSDLRSNLSKVHVLTCTISTKMIALNVYQSSTIKSPILSHLNYPPSFKTGLQLSQMHKNALQYQSFIYFIVFMKDRFTFYSKCETFLPFKRCLLTNVQKINLREKFRSREATKYIYK